LSENLPGVQRTRVKLLDIAIVDKAQYPGASLHDGQEFGAEVVAQLPCLFRR
jgi:hypothetical protein